MQDGISGWLCEEMTREGLEVDQMDVSGNTPLHLAAARGNTATAAALLNLGASVNMKVINLHIAFLWLLLIFCYIFYIHLNIQIHESLSHHPLSPVPPQLHIHNLSLYWDHYLQNDMGLKPSDCAAARGRDTTAEFLVMFETALGVTKELLHRERAQDTLAAEAGDIKTNFK